MPAGSGTWLPWGLPLKASLVEDDDHYTLGSSRGYRW